MSELSNSSDADRARKLPRPASSRGVWLGLLAFIIALAGTELLRNKALRGYAVFLLLVAGVLAIIAWPDDSWTILFPPARRPSSHFHVGSRRRALALLIAAMLLSLLAHVAFLSAPHEIFGVAGCLWLGSIGLLVTAAVVWRRAEPDFDKGTELPWKWWEVGVVAAIAITALMLRVWNLRDVPFNIYPDEIMTGLVAERAYLSGPNHAPVFSTLWSDIELPALWFAMVAGALKLGGISLAVVRLPAALFGAATVFPFYGFVRSGWGRTAAITGASVMAFSAANVHYSRMALNNITTAFFWTACFFFIVRGLLSHRILDWTLAGLAAGVSEHFYYGTRLLPLLLVAFIVYLFIVHWSEAQRYIQHMIWMALGYFIGFGPLLSYFLTHRDLYYGRGAGLMTWNRIPTNWGNLQQMWKTLWPIMSDNLLGVSTQSAQDIMYYAPLLLKSEAALLVLGVALLMWRWRYPAAFLVVLAGVGVIFVGGTLVLYPNSSPPMLAHWTPAFPSFYAAIAVPVGAWAGSANLSLPSKSRWIAAAVIVFGLVVLGCANIRFYFYSYYANPESLRSARYKLAQQSYEEQTVQSRYMASLGNHYRVIVVGQSPFPYDPDVTRYLITGQEYTPRYDATSQPPIAPAAGEGLAFLFFFNSEQYQRIIRERYPRGTAGEVRNTLGRHLFYTYVVSPEAATNASQPR